MTTAFILPGPGDLPDALDATNPASAINRIWRMYNERRMVAAYPNDQRIVSNRRVVDFPFLRYRGGSQAGGNVVVSYDVVPVATLEEAVIDPGANVQTVRFWNGMLSDIYDMAGRCFARTSEVEAGIAGEEYADRWGPSLYGQASFMHEDAGIEGIERRKAEDIEEISGYGTLYEAGDIIGPWCFRDVATLLSLLRYLYITPTRIRGQQKRVVRANINVPLEDLISSLSSQWPGSPAVVDQAVGSFDQTAFIYDIGTKLQASTFIFGGRWRYIGSTSKRYAAPGFIPKRDLRTVSMLLDVYGVPDNQALDSPGGNYDPSSPFVNPERGIAYLVKQDIPAPARADTVQYLDLGEFNDVDDGRIPIRDIHPVVDNGQDQSYGMRMARPFIIGNVSGYEFEGVTEA